MSFPKPPPYSKGKINAAGKSLVLNDINKIARSILNEWRACHGYPINTFQSTLRDRLEKIGLKKTSIVAQRLKRAPTIIDKLKRYPNMNLVQMQDIGGLRAVVPSIKDVNRLVSEYKKGRFKHKFVREKDYISKPRSEDGYRSVHLVYEYQNPKAPEYNGLALELQIRTKLQHSWATGVETVGFILNQALKSRRGDKEWLTFFAIVSAAFAHVEKTPLIPGYEHLSKKDTFKAVARAEKKLSAINTMSGLPVAIERIRRMGSSYHYYLISLRPEVRRLKIVPFTKNELKTANTAYSKAEQEAAESGENIELVLVSAGKINSLKKAYPNFFLDTGDFVAQVEKIINLA